MVAQHPESLVGVDRVAGHQDSLRLLDHRAAAERSLQVVVLGEPLQGDVDRALQLLGGRVDEIGEDAAFRRLPDICRILGGEQRDHGAAGLLDDLLDQLERMLRRETEPDKRDIGVLPRGHRGDRRDVDLAGDHFVPEPGDNLGEQLEPITPLVGDQDAQVLNSSSTISLFLATFPAPMVDGGASGKMSPRRRFVRIEIGLVLMA